MLINKSKVNNNIKKINKEIRLIPYQEISDLYHKNCPTMPKVTRLTNQRKEKIKARWVELKGSLEEFERLFSKAGQSLFLSGSNGKWRGCNFDWILHSEDHVTRILEGVYDKDQSQQPKSSNYQGNQFPVRRGFMSKIILDLCGGTGSWSRPYADAGYDVRLVTLPEHDVRTYEPPADVYGILAAPPCTNFTVSGAQYWMLKDLDGRTIDSMGVVLACLRIIAVSRPSWWAMENPVGKLRRWLGKPRLIFNPCNYGDPYTKRTCLWGIFNLPVKNPIEPVFVTASNGDRYSPIHMKTGGKSAKTKELRSITPPHFARAFYDANR